MERVGLIYKLTIGKYFIIGSTLDFKRREKEYNKILAKGKWNNNILQNIYNKHQDKTQPLKFEILQENIHEFILRSVENIWIGAKCSRYEDGRGGLNLQDAECCEKSPETIERMKIAAKKRGISKVTIEASAEARRGKKLSPETIEKQRQKRLGVKHSIERATKRAKKINLIDKDGNIIKQYLSATLAAEELNIYGRNILQVCNGSEGRKQTGGYRFEFTNKEDKTKNK